MGLIDGCFGDRGRGLSYRLILMRGKLNRGPRSVIRIGKQSMR